MIPNKTTYSKALKTLDYKAVKEDIKKLMYESQQCWLADWGNYGPFFVRLAWHCSGSYRATDGRGGCGGGRQRFPPEADWEDNANLDYARGLLAPIKSMGGPVTQFCGGRIGEPDGPSSLDLGPSP